MAESPWVKDNHETSPPRIHDLEYLYSQTELNLSTEDVDLLRVMNSWNLEGRYQDYKDKFFKETTAEYTQAKMEHVNRLKKWLQSELQRKK